MDCSNLSSSLKSNLTKETKHKLYGQWALSDVWANIEKKYTIDKAVGKGSYGTVVKAVCKASGQKVAIKHMTGFQQHEYDCVKVIREIQIMKGLKAAVRS